MKVYVITAGSYSGYHIVGVTLDEKAAQKYVSYIDDGEVEIYDTDVIQSDSNLYRYTIFNSGFEGIDELTDYGVPENNSNVGVVGVFHGEKNKVYYCTVRAKDKDHALKTARDLVAEYKAHKEGID